MATQKEMRQYRLDFINASVEGIEVEGFVYAGMTVDGAAFENEVGDVVVLKAIAKKESFDLNDAIVEYEEKEAAAKEREVERAAKALEKAEKAAAVAKAKAEKEALKEAEVEI